MQIAWLFLSGLIAHYGKLNYLSPQTNFFFSFSLADSNHPYNSAQLLTPLSAGDMPQKHRTVLRSALKFVNVILSMAVF